MRFISSSPEPLPDTNTREGRKLLRRSLPSSIPPFNKFLEKRNLNLVRTKTEILQLNISLLCNQSCSHCHVEASPQRVNDIMSLDTINKCLKVLRNSDTVKTVDITGGAPELNPNFRYLVQECRKMDNVTEIIDRCNLTVLLEEESLKSNLAEFLVENKIHIIASLPCYGEENVDKQRGKNVFKKSIEALKLLNSLGYGKIESLKLDLVYNPNGAFLPPNQALLEKDYKIRLFEDFGISFNRLFCLTNMPIKRFADHLYKTRQFSTYMELLVNSFNPSSVENLMCKNTISVDFKGNIYDCDFNQQLGMSMGNEKKGRTPLKVFDVESVVEIEERSRILTANHCFGCTAGQGSSCQGATA